MIHKVIGYDNVKVRKSMGEYLLASAMGLNATLEAPDLKEILLEIDKVERNKDVRFFIDASLELL